MKLCTIILFTSIGFLSHHALCQTTLGNGEQPQITVDPEGIVRLVFGQKDKILYARSTDGGNSFSEPVVVATIEEMHLGMARGPQLASSKDFSIVTAIDKKGTIHSFKLDHKTGTWQKMKNVNDVEGSALEGLMGLAADENNNFYAAWLDLRQDRKNNICFSTFGTNSNWTKNKFAYKSPESHVCECCKPSIAVKGNTVSIMFRNWLMGSRDLYLTSSTDKGKTFSEAQKLGIGTWPLKGCPMDGGGLKIDPQHHIHTVWQRDGQVFYARPGLPEEKIGDGRNVNMSGTLVTWESGADLIVLHLNGKQQKIGEGTALKVYEFKDKSVLAVWEKEERILFKKI